MKATRKDLEVLHRRLERLERKSRVQQRFIAAAILVVGCVIVMAETKSVRTVEAERFVLRDKLGRARITIGTPSSSGLAIDTGMDEPVIWISDERGNDRAMFSEEGLRLSDQRFRAAASLTFTKKDGAEILLYDKEGKLVFHAPGSR
jgi:hypothetical protein